MRPDYAVAYQRLYREHWWWRAREDLIVGWLRRLVPPGGFGPILDVGCGDALFFDRLRELGEPQGVEMDPSLVTDAGRRRGPIHVGSFDETFRPGTRFGLVLMLDVIEHFAADVESLRRALDLLAPGGTIVITIPAFPVLWTSHDVVNRHYTRYTRASFAAVAERAGLRVEHTRYLFQWTVPVKLAVRLKERLRPGPAPLPSVPAAPINRALYWLSRAEAASYGRLPLPFGSSLLVVGRQRSPSALAGLARR
ncbi:MAG TPA: class I SAM-dependent methyltransferase [Candidatus Binatia bacterium]|nr:class I SAM-dependent methyltransferase [Candidatus Binatia bacterium]